jgi:uncharacterized protein YcbK (DUF882 family)
MGDLTRHFSWREFECRCGCSMPPDVRERVKELASALEVLRSALGVPLHINSGYRCPARNRKVGGATRSRHLAGDAADLAARGYTGAEIAETIERLIAEGALPEGGLGTYGDRPSIAHYDLRGRRARW